MFLLELAVGVFSYVLAKSIWNFVQIRAKAQNEYPIVWLAKVTAGVLALLFLTAIPVVAVVCYLYLLLNKGSY